MIHYTSINIKATVIILVALFVFSSCKKLELPSVTTATVTNITINSAVGGGTITDEGSSGIVSIGLCWSTDPEPTFQDFKSSEMAGVNEFKSTMKGLLSGTKYYVRAYAVNDQGIGYGNEVTFTTL
jgi:hypothetical protein